jgi:uncharacterized protein (DUF1778 family)
MWPNCSNIVTKPSLCRTFKVLGNDFNKHCNDIDVTFRYGVVLSQGTSLPPASTRRRPPRRDTLNLRIKPEERGLIDRAAALTGKTRTDFVLEAARRAAVEALTERTLFAVDEKAHAKFLAALDAPPRPNDRLIRTMQTPAPWDRA